MTDEWKAAAKAAQIERNRQAAMHMAKANEHDMLESIRNPDWRRRAREREAAIIVLDRMTATGDKAQEARLKRRAKKLGMVLAKSRSRDPDAPGFGLYAVACAHTGGVLHKGGHNAHTLTLGMIEHAFYRCDEEAFATLPEGD